MDQEWVINAIEKIAGFGKNDRGISRLAFTEADLKARQYAINLIRDAGLEVRTDQIGNIIGRLAGKDEHAPAVITGSHLDTVPEGGKYDGVVGVVGGLAAIKRLRNRESLTHSVELLVFAGEESSRFGYATLGSKAMTGAANLNALSKATDHEGINFTQALLSQGFDLKLIKNAIRDKKDIKAFVELHIEQGQILERSGCTIGVVEAIAAPTRCKITVEGVAAHSGATPMDERRDALVSAAMIILAIQEIALGQSHSGTVATVGVLKVHPGAINVVPGLVEMWVDIRGISHESIIESLQEMKDAVSTIADAQETPVAIEILSAEKPVALHSEIIEIIENVCLEKSVDYKRMYSGAGHDAMNMARITPTGMIFIPCHQGLSHNPDEYAAPQDIMAGIDILTETLYRLAK